MVCCVVYVKVAFYFLVPCVFILFFFFFLFILFQFCSENESDFVVLAVIADETCLIVVFIDFIIQKTLENDNLFVKYRKQIFETIKCFVKINNKLLYYKYFNKRFNFYIFLLKNLDKNIYYAIYKTITNKHK